MVNLAGSSKIKILIADDEVWYAEGVTNALESEGYEVIIEPRMTGTRVLEIMRDPSFHIDILILDMMMYPGSELAQEVDNQTSTGITVCKKIRTDIRRDAPNFPIVCLTAVTDESKLSEMSQMGCFILKKAEVSIFEIVGIIKDIERSTGRN